MRSKNLLKIKDEKAFLKELEESKRQNFIDNMKFVRFHAEWLKRTSNEEWSRQQKRLIDEIYRSNRRLRISPAKARRHILYFSIAAIPWKPRSSSLP